MIVRALWGEFIFAEEPLHDELVFVWGSHNEKKLQSRGFKTFLMPDEEFTETSKFYKKLLCWKEASLLFDEFLFLDWDVKSLKNLDENFWKNLRKREISMPTYSYPKEYMDLTDGLEDPGARRWTNVQIEEMKKHEGWVLGDAKIFPNAGFLYCRNKQFPEELIQIAKKYEMQTLIEEFAMWRWANCSLEEYIERHEPSSIFGRPIDTLFNLGPISRRVERPLHELIKCKIEKNVYFVHE
jgi:hypothetical protein